MIKTITILSLGLLLNLNAIEKEDKYLPYETKFMNVCADSTGETKEMAIFLKNVCKCAFNKAKTKFTPKDLEYISNHDLNDSKAKLFQDYLDLNLPMCAEKAEKK